MADGKAELRGDNGPMKRRATVRGNTTNAGHLSRALVLLRTSASGVNGVTIVGVLGESNRLMDSERASLIEAAVEVARSVDRPFMVCVGASHAGTHATVALSAMAQKMGADGVMVTPSKEPAPASDDAIVELFAAVERGCPGLPIVLQDHPASTQARRLQRA